VGPGPAAVAAEDPNRFLNRELSWLAFNDRVLALAEDPDEPVLDRAKFLAIFSDNLDEFFQVRVALLKDQAAVAPRRLSPEGMTPREQLEAIRPEVEGLVKRQSRVLLEEVLPGLAANGIVLSDWDELDDDDRHHLVEVFERDISPVLTPLAVDPSHPFPYISNLSLNLAVDVRDPVTGANRFARVKVPPSLPRFVVMPDGERFVAIEQVIVAHLGSLFPGMEIFRHHPFRVTRNASLSVDEDEADDMMRAIESELVRQRLGGRAVRLEVDSRMSEPVRQSLQEWLELRGDDVYAIDGPLQLKGLWGVYALDRPDLKRPAWRGVTPAPFPGSGSDRPSIFSLVRAGDLLVHHPYDSFPTTVEAFVEQAAEDPGVLAIKQTLYRTAGDRPDDSPMVRHLIRAAERGKQVAVLVELRARFDEQANITWARALEEAGVHVVYGLAGLKTHSKVTLVVRREGDGIRRYCHVGTGNYNPTTAGIYEDLGILTADEDVGADLAALFNHLTGFSRPEPFRRLLVAPYRLRERMAELVAAETRAGEGGRIVMKMNSLVDPAMIDALYAASSAGVRIDLVVRGICCLRPGVPGLSETIRVRSLVGRYLEHSRIYAFGPRSRRRYYLGSADLMPRNLDRRVEAVLPVTDPALTERLQEVLDVNLADDVLAWTMDGTQGGTGGTWTKVATTEGVSSHDRLEELARLRIAGRRGGGERRG